MNSNTTHESVTVLPVQNLSTQLSFTPQSGAATIWDVLVAEQSVTSSLPEISPLVVQTMSVVVIIASIGWLLKVLTDLVKACKS